MAKDKLTDYSATANSNTDVGGINIDEGCPAGNVNNGEREIMSHIAEWLAGTYPIYDTASFADPADLTKIFRFDAGGITTSSTRVITIPDYNGTLATLAGTETLTNKTLTSPTITGTLTIPSGAIATAGIADDAVTLAKMAAGTPGNIITYNASGNPAAVSTGTSGHFLTSNGAGAAPTFQAIPAGVVAWVNFDGTGTPSINASYNVSSITDNGTGDYTLNFTNALVDANYGVSINVVAFSTSLGYVTGVIHGSATGGATLKSTTKLRIMTALTASGGAVDLADITVVMIR